MAVIHTSIDKFTTDVIQHKGVVLVDFYADWCGPCKVTSPIIEELSHDPTYKDVHFVEVDVDADNDLAAQYNILSIPTFLIFRNGEVISQFVGARDKSSFESELKSAL